MLRFLRSDSVQSAIARDGPSAFFASPRLKFRSTLILELMMNFQHTLAFAALFAFSMTAAPLAAAPHKHKKAAPPAAAQPTAQPAEQATSKPADVPTPNPAPRPAPGA